MPKFIARFLVLSILRAGGTFGQVQGTFAQIYGASWQTTFTLINLNSTNPASVTRRYYGDDGLPLNVPVQGFGNTAVYTFTIPPSGAQNVVLSSPDPTAQGWATMSTNGLVRGQGSFRFLLPGAIFEAVVPLSMPNSAPCILPLPQPDNVILVHFDTTG